MLPASFMPHGYCYLWSPWLLFWQVSMDVLIGTAYLVISAILLRIVRQRRDVPFNGVALSFAAFILACGATHFLEAWNVWHAQYWASAYLKMITAAASVGTAFYIFRLQPAILQLPNPRQLAALNAQLELRVTELKQTEAALRASEEHFRTAFDFAGIGMAMVAPDGRWLRVNHRVCEITGYTEAELLGTTFQAITHPDDLAGDLEQVEKLRSGAKRFYQREKRYLHKQGHPVAIRLTVALLRDAAGAPLHFVSQIEDISDRKRLEEQLQQAQKMEAVGQLAGGIAHDYNNILTSTMMQLGILLQDSTQPPAAQKAHADLLKDANRAAALTRQLLTFSRRQVMQMKPLELGLAVENILRMLERLIGENISLRIVTSGPVWVEADVGMIDQVVTNLVINARDAIGPGGGSITLTVGTREFPGDRHTAPDTPRGPFAFVAIRDSGCGIDPDTRRHLFEPFFTTKAPGKGTGLGLATAYGIAKQHRGWIDVESQEQRGSTFTVFLPLLSPPPSSSRPPVDDRPRGGSETILLVEDQDSVRNVARAALERLGYKVIYAPDGPGAIELWREQNSAIELLFSDMVMPHGLSGWQLAQRLQADQPDLPVLLTSGYSIDLKNAGVPAGVEFIQKPYELSALTQAVRRVLRQSPVAALPAAQAGPA
ncbi:MAG TPA: PAS domain S-box protein [Opitutus sp.]|nr:PAS domain S-box protein [Opitutus sp.]